MAEFCLECYNRLHKTNYKKRHVVLDFDLCEGCGEVKKCIIIFKRTFDAGLIKSKADKEI